MKNCWIQGCCGSRKKADRLFEDAVLLEFEPLMSKRAFELYRRAAILGSRKAQFYLAINYAMGVGHPANRRLARAWFRCAANAGEELCELPVTQGAQSLKRQNDAFSELL